MQQLIVSATMLHGSSSDCVSESENCVNMTAGIRAVKALERSQDTIRRPNFSEPAQTYRAQQSKPGQHSPQKRAGVQRLDSWSL